MESIRLTTNPRGLKLLFGLSLVAGMAILAFSFEAIRFMLIGTTGAIFANSTGAGGGVIFIPLFSQFGFTDAQAVSSSFGIQCFGMTAGAIAWTRYRAKSKTADPTWPHFWGVVLCCSVCSIFGIWINYGLNMAPLASLTQVFKLFSIALGGAILTTLLLNRNAQPRRHLNPWDIVILSVLAVPGGILTGWLSVAVGELIAFYLIFRRYDATYAIAIAVIVTAFTVWSVASVHLAADSSLVWDVVKYAGPGAVIGGVLARYLATFMSPRLLKGFFGIWLIVIGIGS